MSATHITIDLTNYKDRSGSRVPEGSYLVRVGDLELVTTKAGDPMVNLFYDIIEGPEAGKTLVDRLVVMDKTMWRIIEFLKAINIPTPRKQLQIPFALIKGKTLRVGVEDGDEFNGRIKSEVRSYAPAQLAAPAPVEAPADLEVPAPAPEPQVVTEAPEVSTAPAPLAAVPDLPADVDADGLDLTEQVTL